MLSHSFLRDQPDAYHRFEHKKNCFELDGEDKEIKDWVTRQGSKKPKIFMRRTGRFKK
jgi:hypothetical protein